MFEHMDKVRTSEVGYQPELWAWIKLPIPSASLKFTSVHRNVSAVFHLIGWKTTPAWWSEYLSRVDCSFASNIHHIYYRDNCCYSTLLNKYTIESINTRVGLVPINLWPLYSFINCVVKLLYPGQYFREGNGKWTLVPMLCDVL